VFFSHERPRYQPLVFVLTVDRGGLVNLSDFIAFHILVRQRVVLFVL
jgi:hypothetical protein